MDVMTPPIWAMRAWRLVSLVFFLVPAAGAVVALAFREWAGAGVLVVSATIFGLNWASVRRVTGLLIRRAERHRR